MPERNSTRVGVMLSSKLDAWEGAAHQRMKPSGRQKEAFHCFELSTVSW